MTSHPPPWRWHHHLIVVFFCFAMSGFYIWLRPGHREARIGLVVVGIALLVVLAAIGWKRRGREDDG